MIPTRPTPPPQRWFRIALPLTWCLVTFGSIANPGDEYGMLLGSAIAGFWPLFFLPSVGNIQSVYGLAIAIGAATLFLFGWFFDRFGVPRRLWAIIWLGIATLICLRMLSAFPNLSRAVSKNGSIEAYVFTSLNLSLYICCIVLPIITMVFRLNRIVPGPGCCTKCGYALTGAPGPRCPECGAEMAGAPLGPSDSHVEG